MKKFYTVLAAVAMLAASASAQTLYFKGSANELSWDPGVDLAVEQTNGAYTVDLTDLSSFKFSTVSSAGGWDDYNSGAYYGADNGCAKKANLGQPIPLELNGADNYTPWKGDYHIVIAGDLSTITLTTTTPEPTEATPLYLRGTMTDWNALDLWKMSSADGITYTFVCSEANGTKLNEGDKFKIADANWSQYNYGAGDEIYAGDPMEWQCGGGSQDGMMGEDFEGTITLVLGKNDAGEYVPNACPMVTLTSNDGIANVAVEAAAPEYFNLQGVRVANPENGLFIVRRGNTVSKIVK